MPATTDDLPTRLRSHIQGNYAYEAAYELLIRHGRAITPNAPWIITHDPGLPHEFVYIDPDVLIAETGAYSGGERRLFAIAASLLGGPPVDLSDALAVDTRNAHLIFAALRHAWGDPAGAAWPT